MARRHDGEQTIIDAPVCPGRPTSACETYRNPGASGELLTFLLTDVEGSTALIERLGDAAAHRILQWHDNVLRRQLGLFGGREVDRHGDGFLFVFEDVSRALLYAVSIQRSFSADACALPEQRIRVRIGLHRGPAIRSNDGFFGKTVVVAARIAALAQGGETVASREVIEGAGAPWDDLSGEPREVELKGLGGAFLLHQIPAVVSLDEGLRPDRSASKSRTGDATVRSRPSAPTAIEPLRPELIPEVVRVLACAFVTNPLHIAAFGGAAQAKNEAFFRVALQAFKGPVFVAMLGSRVVGAVHWVGSPACQFGVCERARTLPRMLRGLGFRSTGRLVKWLFAWGRHDPPVPHVHLGPIGVSPEFQGRRIGHQLMERYCAELDRLQAGGYLETDRIENVTFYRSFGFEVAEEISVLGVANYLMWRPSAA